MDFIFWKGRTEIFLQLSDKFLYGNENKAFDIYTRNRDSVQCSHKVFYQGGAFQRVFLPRFRFKFIVHVLTT